MTDLLAEFPLLFTRKRRARGLDAAIAKLDVAALAAGYCGVRGSARQRAQCGKAYFVGHRSTPGGDSSNRKEEHLARELFNLGGRWPWPGGGWVRPLDYQVLLKA